MNKAIFLLLVILKCYSGICQETVLITKNRSGYYEEYTVLASDKTIKHGSYVRFSKGERGRVNAIEANGNYVNGVMEGYWETYYPESNNIREVGFYENNRRDSIWVFFYPQGIARKLEQVQSDDGSSIQIIDANPIICKTGMYKEGKPVGVWVFFDERGEIFRKFDYDTHSLIFSEDEDINNHSSSYIGGKSQLSLHLYENFDFEGLMKSIHTKVNLTTGRFVFKFKIDERGEIIEVICIERTINNAKIYDRAVEAIKGVTGGFVAKKVNGHKEVSEQQVTFNFVVRSSTQYEDNERFMSRRTTRGIYFTIDVE